MTVTDLINLLGNMDPTAPVHLAIQPNYPFKHEIGEVVETEDGVYISDGGKLGYLASDVRDELAWH